jgi:uncharacterized protein
MNLTGAKEFVIGYLKGNLRPAYHYHDLAHTLDVHESVIRIAGLEGVTGSDLPLLETAALFHDIGMTEQYDDHETASVALSRSVLPGFGYTTGEIDQICTLIMATKMPTGPVTRNERILCDADLDYLGRTDFFMRSFQLKVEWELLGVLTCSPEDWLRNEAEFLHNHLFHTVSAQTTRNPGKSENLDYIEKFLRSFTK